MQSSGMYVLSESSQLEYVRNCILVVIGHPRIVCVHKLYNYNGIIYKYRVKWYSNTWSNWPPVFLCQKSRLIASLGINSTVSKEELYSWVIGANKILAY